MGEGEGEGMERKGREGKEEVITVILDSSGSLATIGSRSGAEAGFNILRARSCTFNSIRDAAQSLIIIAKQDKKTNNNNK